MKIPIIVKGETIMVELSIEGGAAIPWTLRIRDTNNILAFVQNSPPPKEDKK